MTDDSSPTKTERYWHCPCGILTILIDFTPKMRKIKRIRPHMNFHKEDIGLSKRCCLGFMDYSSWDWTEDDLSRDRLVEHFDRFKKAGIGFDCGNEWEEYGRVFRHCLDAIFHAVEKNIPEKEPKEEEKHE